MNVFKEMMYILMHPINGFEDMKQYKTGSLYAAGIVSLLWFFASLVHTQYTSPWFNANDTEKTNILLIFVSTVVLYIFFTISNWSICTLFDGEGSYIEIVIVTAYSLIPYVVSLFAVSIFSYFLSLDEYMFINVITSVGLLYSVIMLMIGMIQIHQYNFIRMGFALIVSVIGVFLILFLSFLMLMLIREIIEFFRTITNELLMRSVV